MRTWKTKPRFFLIHSLWVSQAPLLILALKDMKWIGEIQKLRESIFLWNWGSSEVYPKSVRKTYCFLIFWFKHYVDGLWRVCALSFLAVVLIGLFHKHFLWGSCASGCVHTSSGWGLILATTGCIHTMKTACLSGISRDVSSMQLFSSAELTGVFRTLAAL